MNDYRSDLLHKGMLSKIRSIDQICKLPSSLYRIKESTTHLPKGPLHLELSVTSADNLDESEHCTILNSLQSAAEEETDRYVAVIAKKSYNYYCCYH